MTRAVLLALALATTGQESGPTLGRPEVLSLSGRASKAVDALAAVGLPADPGPLAEQVVLVGPDGSIRPILSDEASRALFLDERLRGRPLELSARRYPGVDFLQVLTFKVEHEGKWRTPEYYCDICTISVRYPQICPCCQGPMELRMKPEAP